MKRLWLVWYTFLETNQSDNRSSALRECKQIQHHNTSSNGARRWNATWAGNRFVNTAGCGSITEVTTPSRAIQLSARLSF